MAVFGPVGGNGVKNPASGSAALDASLLAGPAVVCGAVGAVGQLALGPRAAHVVHAEHVGRNGPERCAQRMNGRIFSSAQTRFTAHSRKGLSIQ